jgi:hypothetical protein
MIPTGCAEKEITNLPLIGEVVLFVSLVFEFADPPLTDRTRAHKKFCKFTFTDMTS